MESVSLFYFQRSDGNSTLRYYNHFSVVEFYDFILQLSNTVKVLVLFALRKNIPLEIVHEFLSRKAHSLLTTTDGDGYSPSEIEQLVQVSADAAEKVGKTDFNFRNFVSRLQ